MLTMLKHRDLVNAHTFLLGHVPRRAHIPGLSSECQYSVIQYTVGKSDIYTTEFKEFQI